MPVEDNTISNTKEGLSLQDFWKTDVHFFANHCGIILQRNVLIGQMVNVEYYAKVVLFLYYLDLTQIFITLK